MFNQANQDLSLRSQSWEELTDSQSETISGGAAPDPVTLFYTNLNRVFEKNQALQTNPNKDALYQAIEQKFLAILG